jgi:hypothetical protein
VTHEARTMPIANGRFQIPPHDPNYRVESSRGFRPQARLVSFMPHMHLRGKDFRCEAVYPGGRKEVLLSVPRYNFNWQSVYRFKEPLKVPKGTKLTWIGHWDNSADNPANTQGPLCPPNSPLGIKYGLASGFPVKLPYIRCPSDDFDQDNPAAGLYLRPRTNWKLLPRGGSLPAPSNPPARPLAPPRGASRPAPGPAAASWPVRCGGCLSPVITMLRLSGCGARHCRRNAAASEIVATQGLFTYLHASNCRA